MTFLGLEKPVGYEVLLIFDPTMAKMVLDALDLYIAAARGEYERGLLDIKDFTNTYGDFMSPFAKDMARYNDMINGVRSIIDDAYAHGIDLTKSPQGRAIIQRAINSVNPAEYNAMRANAKAGYAYLDSLRDLAAKGKSSKELEDYISSLPGNVSFDDFSTKGQSTWNTWNRMPTEYSTLQEFVHPSFAHLKPHLLTAEEAKSRLGSEYDPRAEYKGITRSDMEASMRDILPGLTGNPIYGFYRQLAKNQLVAEGNINPTDDQVNERFIQNAVTADHLMMVPLDSDYSRYYKEQELKLKQESNALSRARFEFEKQTKQQELELERQKLAADAGGPGTQLEGISLANAWYDTAMAKAWSADGFTMDWDKMGNSYGLFGENAERIFHDFGLKYANKKKDLTKDLLIKAMREGGESEADIKAVEKDQSDFAKMLPKGPISSLLSYPLEVIDEVKNERNGAHSDIYNRMYNKYSTNISPNQVRSIWKAYEDKFSIPMDEKAVAEIVGTPLSDNKGVAKISAAIIDKLYGVDDVITNTSGYTKTYQHVNTDEIREWVKKYGPENFTATPLGKGYGSLRKDSGSFEVTPKIRLTYTDPNTGKKKFRDCYVDIGLGSNSTPGGSYLGNYQEYGGVQQHGDMTNPPLGPELGIGGYSGPVQFGESTRSFTIDPKNSTRVYNMYPDYNRWTQYGVWDTDVTSSLLHAGLSQKLATY